MNAYEKRKALRQAKSAQYYQNAKLKKSNRHNDAIKYYEEAFHALNAQYPLTIPKESPEALLSYGRQMYAQAHALLIEAHED